MADPGGRPGERGVLRPAPPRRRGPVGSALKALRRSIKEPVQRGLAWASVLPLDRTVHTVAELASMDPRVIVAARTDRIGDLLVSSPLLYALHRRWPAARVYVVHGPKNRAVLEGMPYVEPGPVFRRDPASWAQVAAWLSRRRFDLAVSLRAEAMADVFVAAWSRAPVRMNMHATKTRAAYNVIVGPEIRHHVTRFCRAAALLGAPCTAMRPVYFIPEEASRRAEEELRSLRPAGSQPVVGVQIPNRSHRHQVLKAWPLGQVVMLVRALAADGVHVVLCAVGSERGDAALVRAAVPQAVIAPQLPLSTFAGVLRGFDLFVSGFTGPMHLADAVGTPTVAMGTPVQHEYWRALGALHRVVVASSPDQVPAREVLEAARSTLAARLGGALGLPDTSAEG